MNDDYIKQKIQQALRNDSTFSFRETGRMFRQGVCPSCGQKELYVSVDEPWRVSCGRLNNCSYSETTRSLYPQVFESVYKSFPATDERPNAPAEAYLALTRGLSVENAQGMFSLEWRHVGDRQFVPAVRFGMWDGGWWERYIDDALVKKHGIKKNRIKTDWSYRHKCWAPTAEPQDGTCRNYIKKNDMIIITEGIFNTLAWTQTVDPRGKNYKSITAFSSNNIPYEVFEANKDKDVLWIAAYDADKAGRLAAVKFRAYMEKHKQRYLIALTHHENKDWNDILNDKKLDEDYLNESVFRGYYQLARSSMEKAMLHFSEYGWRNGIIAHNNALWKYKISLKDVPGTVQEDFREQSRLPWMMVSVKNQNQAFSQMASLKKISNCDPKFLYIERNALTNERQYTFEVSFESGDPEDIMTLPANCTDSAVIFNRLLMENSDGGTFSGKTEDLLHLRDSIWLGKKKRVVTTYETVGYQPKIEAYVFKDFAFYKGQFLRPNKEGFFPIGKRNVKCGEDTVDLVVPAKTGDLSWVEDYKTAYHNNGLTLLSWWIGNLFACQVRHLTKDWPFLEYTGEPDSGKSTQLEFLWNCMGREGYEGIDPSKSTAVGRARNFQQVSNLPIVLMEGDHSGGDDRKGRFDFDELKTAFNGRSIRAMGTKKQGAKTIEPPFMGGLLFAQNDPVRSSDAIHQRIVHCHCTTADHSNEGAVASKRLENMPAEEVNYFLHQVLTKEKVLLEKWEAKFKEIHEAWKDRPVHRRLIRNHAKVAAWAHCLPIVFGTKHFPAEKVQEIEEYIWTRALDRQGHLLADHPLVQQFWEYFEFLNPRNRIDEKGHVVGIDEVLNLSKDQDLIAINLPMYERTVNQHDLERPKTKELKQLLKHSQKYKFVDFKNIRSKEGKVVKCWLFKKKSEKE